MPEPKWTTDDWAKWRKENMRLALEGWRLHSDQMMDGSVREYATKDGQEIDRTPNWERDEEGNYIYGSP